jgi:DNA-binding GntR family transcriptional regulator
VATIPGGGSTEPIPLALRPLSANVSFRDQAYAALKRAIMDADIYSHPHELRLDERQLSRSRGVWRTPLGEAETRREQGGVLRTVAPRGRPDGPSAGS